MIVGVISCGSLKRAEACAARDLYCGRIFVQAREVMERKGYLYVILSARYGALRPDDPVEPYNEKVSAWPRAQQAAWARRTNEQLRAMLPPGCVLYSLVGKAYANALTGFTVIDPLQGLRMGYRSQALSRMLRAHP